MNQIDSKLSCIDDKEVKYSRYSPSICGHGHFGYGLSVSIVFTIYVFFVVGVDQAFAKFYFSFLKFDKFKISTNGASWGIILFWLFFSVNFFIFPRNTKDKIVFLDWSIDWYNWISIHSGDNKFSNILVWWFSINDHLDCLCLDSWIDSY